MSKLAFAGLVSVLLIAALCTVLVVYAEESQQQFDGRPMPEALYIEPKAMTENSGFYNVYLTINAFAPDTINKIQLNKNMTGLTTYVNGTVVDTANPLQIKLDSGDLIGVNFTMPCPEYSSVNEVSVFSTGAMYYRVMPSSFQPHLVTNLGWYLHNSSDPVSGMANKFTIYGNILNTGAIDAHNCYLVIEFYSNEKLLQTSNVPIGEINGLCQITSLNTTNVPCSAADYVTRTEVCLKGDNVPNA
jgi:hypothetical protein